MRTASTLWTSRVAAFLAVALLSVAGVKSAVMQVGMATAPAADCAMPTMSGMAVRHVGPEGAKVPGSPSKADCPFCADASAPPIIAYVEPLRPPSSTVFVVAPARPPLGARAPPAFTPKARGPPAPFQTA